MNAFLDRLVELLKVFVFAYGTDDAVRLAVLLTVAALWGLLHLVSVLSAEPGAASARLP